MKENRIFLVIICMITCTFTFAQESSENKNFLDKLWGEVEITRTSKYHTLKPYSHNINVGIDLTKSFYMFINDEFMLCLRKADGEKNYFKSYNIGGGLGYSIYTYKAKDRNEGECFDIKAQVTTSLGKSDWKNTAYSLGIYYRHKYSCSSVQPYFGIGYRFINSREIGLSNHSGMYLTFGIRR